MRLSFAEQVRIIAKRENKSVDEIAGLLKMSRQNFWQQMNRDNFREKDMLKIAEVLDCTVNIELKQNDGGSGAQG